MNVIVWLTKTGIILPLMKWVVTLMFSKDMINIRDDITECASLGMNDANDIIDEICLNRIECIFYFLKCLFCRLFYYSNNQHIKIWYSGSKTMVRDSSIGLSLCLILRTQVCVWMRGITYEL